MLILRKIAITGGLSAGKTTVCRLFAEMGAFVVSADEIVHRLFSSNETVQKQVVSLLGPEILVNDRLSHEKIAKKVFSNPETLKSLEQLIHPLVFHEIQQQYEQAKNNPNYSLFIAEVPLLYETESECQFDTVVVVLSEENQCRKRFLMKHLAEEEFNHRMLRQIPPASKAAKADYVLLNNSNLTDLKKQVEELSLKLVSI